MNVSISSTVWKEPITVDWYLHNSLRMSAFAHSTAAPMGELCRVVRTQVGEAAEWGAGHLHVCMGNMRVHRLFVLHG
jgi:hypothetical protein